MCRAGKDGRVRICPGQKNELKIKEHNIQRQVKYMKDKMAERLAAFKTKVADLNKEALAEGRPPLDEKTVKKMEVAEVHLKATDITYIRHSQYAHSMVDALVKHNMETDKVHKIKVDEGNESVISAHSTNNTHGGMTSGGETQWHPERAKLHTELVREFFNDLEAKGTVLKNKEAVFSGGLGGAGKSTVLRRKELANIDPDQYVTINPDDIKEIMAAKGLIPEVVGLSPMEASPLVHEEASHISSMVAALAIKRGMNVIYDTTMANEQGTREKIDNLRYSGYKKIDAVFVDITPETSGTRAEARHLRGFNNFLMGKGHGGRLLPKHLTEKQKIADPDYNSKNAKTFIDFQAAGLFDSSEAYDNDVEGRDPIRLRSVNKSLNAA
jgi:predicted kinase